MLVLLDHGIFVPAADQPLDGEEGVDRVGDGLPLRRDADQFLAVVREGDNGRRGVQSLGVLEHARGLPPSITATHELVVPRSMPMTFAIVMFLSLAADRPDPQFAAPGPRRPSDQGRTAGTAPWSTEV